MQHSQQALADALEQMVDAYTLHSMLEALSDVCMAKSEHLISNWQDSVTGHVWSRAAGILDKAASRIDL